MIPSRAHRESLKRFLAPISELMEDPAVSEIMINGFSSILVERKGKIETTELVFPCREALDAALTNIAQYAGVAFGPQSPILEAHLPDGSRIEAILPPIVEDGPVVAVRRFSKNTLTMERLLASSSLTEQAARYLRRAVEAKMNLVVSGGTGSGKTSMLGALSGLIDDRERIIVIEDTREVQLQKSHVVYLETRSADKFGRGRITMRDLLRATLRLRPDRIVVGEVRGGEALDLLQAMNSGHGGSMTTAHANSALDTLRRIETMAMMDDTGMPLAALRAQVISAIQLIVCVERIASGARRVSEISLVDTNRGSSEFAVFKAFDRSPTGELVRNEKMRNGEEID